MKNSSRFKSDGKKLVEKISIVELRKIERELATALNARRRNPFYPNSKPNEKTNYDENEPFSKLRCRVKIKRLNAKPSKKELKKSTFDENQPLSKLRRNKKLNAKPSKKELKKSTHDEKLRQDEKLLKLRKNPFYKKPSIEEQKEKLLPAQVKLRKLDLNSKSLYRKFPKLVVRKF